MLILCKVYAISTKYLFILPVYIYTLFIYRIKPHDVEICYTEFLHGKDNIDYA